MLYNFLKIALRNIKRHKLFSVINIVSLTLSLTFCLAALIIIKNQLNFDEFHPYPDRTYRVITEAKHKIGGSVGWATTPFPLGKRLEKNVGFVKKTVTISYHTFNIAAAGGKKLSVLRAFTGPVFFDVFGFKLKSGNPATVLADPFSVVITKETANRYFGDRNPIGKTFTIEGLGNFTITGVLKPPPNNTHLQFDVLASISTIPLLEQSTQSALTGWDDYKRSYTYVLTKPGTPQNALKKVLPSLSNYISKNFELNPKIEAYTFHLQPLTAIPTGKYLRAEIAPGKTRPLMGLFSIGGIALVILLMACFNYTNLSIARALRRAREVGMYKIFGAGRLSIFVQFVIQAILIAIISLVIAYALLPFVPLPWDVMHELQSVPFDFSLVVWLLLFAVFTGLLAGGLPAWLLSSLKPVKMMKNAKNLNLIEGFTVRKTLVVVQLAISFILIIFTTVTYRQTQFAATADYGFRQENIINLNLQGIDYEILREEISQIAGVKKVSAISRRFGIFPSGSVKIKKEKTGTPIRAEYYSAGRNIIATMDLNLIAGSNFPESVLGNNSETHIIVNEELIARLGWEKPTAAVGQTVLLDDSVKVEVAGVIENFHYESFMQTGPLVLRYQPKQFNFLNIWLASNSTENFERKLKKVWQNVAPLLPIKFSSTKEYLYRIHSYTQAVTSISFYALVALIIGCLGLLGMVTYTVEVRTQEVGIRKVLGASVKQVIYLLSKEFIWLLGLAALIGLPIGYLLGVQFLNTYSYHVSIGFGTLTLGFGIMLLVGILAIGIQTWKIARMNPIESIRSEV